MDDHPRPDNPQSAPAPPVPPARLGRADWVAAGALATVAAVVYGLTSHGDWVFDALRYADRTQEGELSSLLLLLHALANLAPLAAFNVLDALGWSGGALPVLEAVTAAGTALAIAVAFLTTRMLGVSVPAALAAALLLAVSLGAWRAAASAGVYGLTLLTLALGWLAAMRFAFEPTPRRAALLGAAGGLVVATHLAGVTFVVIAVALVALAGPAQRVGARVRIAAITVGAAVVTALPILLITAGLATDWSGDGIREWFVGPHVPEADPSRTVGFGLGGLVTAFASEIPPRPSVAGGAGELALAATLILLALAAAGAAFALRNAGPTRRAGVALAAGAGAAIFAAAWYQAERPDYFSLALVPLALLWGLGADGVARVVASRARAAWLAGLALLAICLGAWNLEGEVGQTLDRSRERETATRAILAEAPADARVVLSPAVAPRAAYEGARAETGWAALLDQVSRAGAEPPGLHAYLAAEDGPVFVSSGAFALSPAQVEYLGADGDELWRELRRCCRPQPVAEFATDGGPETLYRLSAPASSAASGGSSSG